jgi:hypothetical protein
MFVCMMQDLGIIALFSLGMTESTKTRPYLNNPCVTLLSRVDVEVVRLMGLAGSLCNIIEFACVHFGFLSF